MKIWIAIILLSAVALSNAAGNEVPRVPTEVVKADVSESTQVPIGIDENAESTEPPPLTANGEKNERKKEKLEKQKDEGKHDKEENEENEDEEGENEEEESDEGDSDEEDSEEAEAKRISKKKVAKAESEEENNNNEKGDVFKRPSVVLPRSRPSDSPVQPYKPVDASRSGHRTGHPENLFNPAKSVRGNAEVHNPKFDIVKPSTEFPIWSRPVDSARRLDDAGPLFRSTEFHETEERKANHPKWFFNTPKTKSSDESAKKEIHKVFVPEIPISKPAFAQVPAWPITTIRPAVRESYQPAVSQSDHGNSRPKLFFNAAPKSLDGFNKKENSQPVDVYVPAYKSTAAEARPWSRPVTTSPAPPTVGLPIYRATDSYQASTRKVYPRWFFNVKN